MVDWREDAKPPVHNPPPAVPRKRNQSNETKQEATPSERQGQESQSLVPVFRLKAPRPDICMGLSDDSLVMNLQPGRGRSAARSFLFELQDTASLISDSHITPVGVRFPFLVVEAKACATGGNIYQAQNQAAVGGSAALQILQNLWELKDAQDPDQTPLVSHITFSITTEGPIHELWLHFR